MSSRASVLALLGEESSASSASASKRRERADPSSVEFFWVESSLAPEVEEASGGAAAR